MNSKEFFMNVVAMRVAQQQFLERKDEYWKESSARYEKIIDDEIARVQKILKEESEKRKMQ